MMLLQFFHAFRPGRDRVSEPAMDFLPRRRGTERSYRGLGMADAVPSNDHGDRYRWRAERIEPSAPKMERFGLDPGREERAGEKGDQPPHAARQPVGGQRQAACHSTLTWGSVGPPRR